jgi:ferritin-like metal-binding protein YciE
MKKIKSLSELFMEELKDLYSAENQLIKALPKMAQATTSHELKTAIENHLQ